MEPMTISSDESLPWADLLPLGCPNCSEDVSLRHDLCILALEVVDRRRFVEQHSSCASRAALAEAEDNLSVAVSCTGDLPPRLSRPGLPMWPVRGALMSGYEPLA